MGWYNLFGDRLDDSEEYKALSRVNQFTVYTDSSNNEDEHEYIKFSLVIDQRCLDRYFDFDQNNNDSLCIILRKKELSTNNTILQWISYGDEWISLIDYYILGTSEFDDFNNRCKKLIDKFPIWRTTFRSG